MEEFTASWSRCMIYLAETKPIPCPDDSISRPSLVVDGTRKSLRPATVLSQHERHLAYSAKRAQLFCHWQQATNYPCQGDICSLPSRKRQQAGSGFNDGCNRASSVCRRPNFPSSTAAVAVVVVVALASWLTGKRARGSDSYRLRDSLVCSLALALARKGKLFLFHLSPVPPLAATCSCREPTCPS